MVRKYFILSLYLFIYCTVNMYAQNAWNKIYDFCPDTTRSSKNIAQYADSNELIVAGHTETDGISSFHCYIATLDYNGNIKHSKELYSPGKINMIAKGYYAGTDGNPLIKTGKNRYLLTGIDWDNQINSKVVVNQPFFYFFDNKCDSLLLVKYTDTIISHIPYSVAQDKDGNIMVAGQESSRKLFYDAWSQNYWWDSMYVWLAKYDADANLIWSKKMLGGDNHGTAQSAPGNAYKIINSHDGLAYIISGIAFNPAKNTSDLFYMKTDVDGNMVWLKFLPREYEAWGQMDITPLQNGSYGFVATIGGPIQYDTYTYYGAFDEYGDTLWTKRFRKYNGDITGQQILEAENKDLIIYSQVYNYKRTHGIMRTTPTGNIKWYREYLYADTSYFNHKFSAMSYTPSRQVFLSGYFSSPQAVPGVFDTTGLYSWFVLTDTFGCIEPGCQAGDTVWWLTNVNEIAAKPVEVQVYPNPVKDNLLVRVKSTAHKNLRITITAISGRVIFKGYLPENGSLNIDMQYMNSGLYFLEIWDERQKLYTSKVNKL